MIGAWIGLAWVAVVGVGLAAQATLERRARLLGRAEGRPELAPLRRVWGGGLEHPPAHHAPVRALAAFARLVRADGRVEGHRRALRRLARALALVAIATGIATLPLAGPIPGVAMETLRLIAVPDDLVVLGLVLLVIGFARVVMGLAERSPWAHLGGARQASRLIAATLLLVLVLAPIVLDAGALDLDAIVADQQRALGWSAALASALGPEGAAVWARWPLPAWNVLVQPLTALLFAAALSLHVATPRIDDPASGVVTAAGLGLDADPRDAYWSRVEAGGTRVFAAAAFVVLFLGGGGLPFVPPERLIELAAPFVGEGLPRIGVGALQAGAFALKLVLVLALAARLGRGLAEARDDRSLRLATRRLMPLAWANLLLVAGLTLWWARTVGEAAG